MKHLTIFLLVFSVVFCAPAATGTASVADIPRETVRLKSSRIDSALQRVRSSKGLARNPRISDEVFVRRVYLDIAGRIPTYAEAMAFLDDNHPHRRERLIDTLLDSDGYAHRYFIFWADILRIKTNMNGSGPMGGTPYIDWLKNALKTNMPYDQLVHSLISARGALWDEGNGAVGYYLRDQGMQLDNMANSVRIFLGTRIECAMCHDHPYDKWTQRQFYEMAAFTSGVEGRVRDSFQPTLQQFRRGIAGNMELQQASRPLLDILGAGTENTGIGQIRLPKDYQYDDASPNQVVMAATLFGEKAPAGKPTAATAVTTGANKKKKPAETGSRLAFADWITSSDNPRFTTVIVNRLWKETMGRALIEPLDNMTDKITSSHPELLAQLEGYMQEANYDIKQFLRLIFYTQTYQSAAVSRDFSEDDTFYFEGPMMRRMSAEQMWDSLLTLTVPNVDSRTGYNNSYGFYEFFKGFSEYSGMELVQEIENLAGTSYSSDEPMRRNLVQTIRNRNAGNADQGMVESLNKQKSILQAKMRAAREEGRFGESKTLKRQYSMQGLDNPDIYRRNLVRAAELTHPPPPGHFIREFGGSDREQIENTRTEAEVTQILSLLNGYIDQNLLKNRRSILWQNVDEAGTVNSKIDVIYRSLLCREPKADEMTLTVRAARTYRDEALDDLVWMLVNSREFMFIL